MSSLEQMSHEKIMKETGFFVLANTMLSIELITAYNLLEQSYKYVRNKLFSVCRLLDNIVIEKTANCGPHEKLKSLEACDIRKEVVVSIILGELTSQSCDLTECMTVLL